MQLKEIIQKLLDEKKWDQSQLGKELGLSQSNISSLKRGATELAEKYFQAFLKLIELSDDLADECRRRLKSPDGKHLPPSTRPHR